MDTLSDAYSYINRIHPSCNITTASNGSRALLDVFINGEEDPGHGHGDEVYLFVQGEDLEQLV